MMESINALLVDTNVWLDYYIASRDRHDVANTFLHLCLNRHIDLLYSVTTIPDVFYVVGQSYKQALREEVGTLSESDARAIGEIAWACVANMQELATAAGANDTDVRLATKYRTLFRDFEDNLIMAIAQRTHVRYLVTNDEALLRNAIVPCVTPERMCGLLELETELP